MELRPGEHWLHATLPVAEWPADAPAWAPAAAHGDRRIEIGLVGMDADVAAVRRALRGALVTKAEFALGAEAWQEWEDKVSPFVAQQSETFFQASFEWEDTAAKDLAARARI